MKQIEQMRKFLEKLLHMIFGDELDTIAEEIALGYGNCYELEQDEAY